MKTLLVVSSLTILGVAAGAVADTPTVRRAVIRAAEVSLNDRLARIFPDTQLAVTSQTPASTSMAIGAVFTAKMNPVSDGTSLMHSILRPDEKAQVLARRKPACRSWRRR